MDGLYALAGPAAGEEGRLGVVVIGGWPLCIGRPAQMIREARGGGDWWMASMHWPGLPLVRKGG